MHPDDAAHVPGVGNVEVKENSMFSRGFAEAVVGTSLVKIDPHSLINQVREVLNIEETPAVSAPEPAVTTETSAEASAEVAAPKSTARKTKSASTASTTRSRKTAAAKAETSTTAKRRTSTSTATKKPARATKKATNAA